MTQLMLGESINHTPKDKSFKKNEGITLSARKKGPKSAASMSNKNSIRKDDLVA